MKHDGRGQGACVDRVSEVRELLGETVALKRQNTRLEQQILAVQEGDEHDLQEQELGFESGCNDVHKPVDGAELLATKLRKYLASGSGRPGRREAQ